VAGANDKEQQGRAAEECVGVSDNGDRMGVWGTRTGGALSGAARACGSMLAKSKQRTRRTSECCPHLLLVDRRLAQKG
jgi:hypothetical protein